MIVTKKTGNATRVLALTIATLASGLLANHAKAAAALYFDNNGSGGGYGTGTNGVYNWDADAATTGNNGEWATATGGTTATGLWVQGSAAVFNQTATPTTIDVSNDEQVANQTFMIGTTNYTEAVDFAETTANITMHIAQTPSTSGDLDIGSSSANFYIATGTSTLAINAPIVGSGGEVVQHGAGALELYGVNTFSGGFDATGGQDTYYNSSKSFGTGNIYITGGLNSAFLTGVSGTQVTIPNNWVLTDVYPLILVGGTGTLTSPGTIFSGNFPIPTGTTQNFETSSVTTTVDEISGVISGTTTSDVEVSDTGTMIFAGHNTYKGTTLVSSTLNATSPPTLVLGASGTIASSSEVIMSGGILNPDGLLQDMSSTTLDMTVSSTLDYGVGAAEMDFANSSALAWTGTLNLANWTFGADALRFGTDATGLTSAQLADIEFNGSAANGMAALDANGYVVLAPEPSAVLLLLGASLLPIRRRRAR